MLPSSTHPYCWGGSPWKPQPELDKRCPTGNLAPPRFLTTTLQGKRTVPLQRELRLSRAT